MSRKPKLKPAAQPVGVAFLEGRIKERDDLMRRLEASEARVRDLLAHIDQLTRERDTARAVGDAAIYKELVATKAKDEAYAERNKLVAYLASQFPSGLARTDIPGWDAEWHGCVYIDTPAGQMSWHYHDREASLFAHLPPYQGEWDGHTTEQKYDRLRALKPKEPT